MITAAQELKLEWTKEAKIEGKIEGKIEEKVQIIENFLKIGVDWDTIMKATGVNPQKLEELKSMISM